MLAYDKHLAFTCGSDMNPADLFPLKGVGRKASHWRLKASLLREDGSRKFGRTVHLGEGQLQLQTHQVPGVSDSLSVRGPWVPGMLDFSVPVLQLWVNSRRSSDSGLFSQKIRVG